MSISSFAIAHEPDIRPSLAQGKHLHDLQAAFISIWESRYLSEGRDALNGDSIWVNSLEISYGDVSGAVWYGNSPDQDYDELQVSLGIGHAFQAIEISGGYTYLYFPFDGSDDHELGITLGWSDLPMGLELSLDPYYSFDANGLFIEVSLGREFELSETFSLGLFAVHGMNQGYIPDGHDGPNNIAFRVEGSVALGENLSLAAHGSYNWGMDENPDLEGDAQLFDFFHASLGLVWGF